MFFILLENCIKLYNAFNAEEYAATAMVVVELSKVIKIKLWMIYG